MKSPSPVPKGNPVDRAFAAYFRTEGAHAPLPANTSDVVELDRKEYVVLRNVNGVLAVYRIRTSGVLKRLVRWPSELEP
jgi:hypothetical protein